MAWNTQPTIGFASWNGNATLATTKQLLSTSQGLENEIGTINPSTWANYPAVSNVNLNTCNITNVNSITASNITTSGTSYINNLNTTGLRPNFPSGFNTSGANNFNFTNIDNASNINGNVINITPQNNLNLTTSNAISNVVDRGSDIGGNANISLTAQKGAGSFVTINAKSADSYALTPASAVNVTAEGNVGSTSGIPYGGAIRLTANAGLSGSGVTTAGGGAINLTAYTYNITAPGVIRESAGSILAYSGATTPLLGVYGYSYYSALLCLSLTAGATTPSGSYPGVVYLRGDNGTKVVNGFYADTITTTSNVSFGGNLNMGGCNITNVNSITPTSGTLSFIGTLNMNNNNISNVNNIYSSNLSNANTVYTTNLSNSLNATILGNLYVNGLTSLSNDLLMNSNNIRDINRLFFQSGDVIESVTISGNRFFSIYGGGSGSYVTINNGNGAVQIAGDTNIYLAGGGGAIGGQNAVNIQNSLLSFNGTSPIYLNRNPIYNASNINFDQGGSINVYNGGTSQGIFEILAPLAGTAGHANDGIITIRAGTGYNTYMTIDSTNIAIVTPIGSLYIPNTVANSNLNMNSNNINLVKNINADTASISSLNVSTIFANTLTTSNVIDTYVSTTTINTHLINGDPTLSLSTSALNISAVGLPASLVTQSFSYTGSDQYFTVPAGVTSITITSMLGAGGGGNTSGSYSTPGRGGSVSGTLAVTPGEVLTIVVGAGGGTNPSTASVYGGGAAGNNASQNGTNGGGRTAIMRGSTDVVTAGGGGGGAAISAYADNNGGAGGGSTGTNGGGFDHTFMTPTGGGAGTQTAAGAGGTGTPSGASGSPGSGKVGGYPAYQCGGGGGGYFGGGGGGYSISDLSSSGAGGGGSAYVALLTGTVITTQGGGAAPTRNGSLTFTYTPSALGIVTLSADILNLYTATNITGATTITANTTMTGATTTIQNENVSTLQVATQATFTCPSTIITGSLLGADIKPMAILTGVINGGAPFWSGTTSAGGCSATATIGFTNADNPSGFKVSEYTMMASLTTFQNISGATDIFLTAYKIIENSSSTYWYADCIADGFNNTPKSGTQYVQFVASAIFIPKNFVSS